MPDKTMLSAAVEARKDIIKMTAAAKSGHPGGSLSAVEILVALYYGAAKTDPSKPGWEERDRIVLSKGHAAPVLYAVLAGKGFFPRGDLLTLRKTGSYLQGHPDMHKVPGVDMSTGSLGQGASVSVGMAIAGKRAEKPYKVFAVLGDGELQEGLVWEAAMAAAHYRLDNLSFIIDNNGLQIDGRNSDVMDVGDVAEKFRAFGFYTAGVDGHNTDRILEALARDTGGKPRCIVAKTTKGKGVSFMENQAGWHGKAPSAAEAEKALAELEAYEIG
ncbi:MAG: transketolase [Oscillospiraceae bacterium]|jgi:transketolase|nr:transketolase [Oscillospiraceae bacterium]